MSYKFGLNLSPIDVRNFQLEAVLSKTVPLPPLPDVFEVDQKLGYSFAESLFGNDKYGDCVIAYRANQTLRFEYPSQKKQIPVTTDDCLNEYWLEQGYVPPKCWLQRVTSTPPDKGLSLLSSLKAWRSNGWIAGGQRYDIYAFLQISVGNNWWNSTDPTLLQVIAKDDLLLKEAVYLLGGAPVR